MRGGLCCSRCSEAVDDDNNVLLFSSHIHHLSCAVLFTPVPDFSFKTNVITQLFFLSITFGITNYLNLKKKKKKITYQLLSAQVQILLFQILQ